MKRLLLVITALLVLVLGGISCAPSAAPAPAETPAPAPPASAISWDEAKYHIGDRLTVCGPVVDIYWASGSKGKPTFLNIGKPYPDPQRFTVVIWIDYRSNFPQPPEKYYLGKTICVTGLIESYKGSPQIEAQQLSQIQEQ